MYMEENCSFDPTTNNQEAAPALAPEFQLSHINGGGFSGEEQQNLPYAAAAILEMELQQQQQQQQLAAAYNNSESAFNDNNNWQYHHHHQQQVDSAAAVVAQHDLLNLFHFSPPSAAVASSSLTFEPLLHLNLPAPHPPPLFHYNGGGGGGGFLGGEGLYGGHMLDVGPAEMESGGVLLEFGRERGGGGGVSIGRATKHFASERHRRDQMRDTYSMLRSLVPNPTKNDRASVVGDAIEYIKELRRSVNELKILVEQKRRGRDHNKRHKSDDDDPVDPTCDGGGPGAGTDVNGCCNAAMNIKPDPDNFSQIRSSWLRRKSKDTEVDVRIVDDDVTVKLVQRKKINLLLTASRVLDDLQLDLRHVAGGHVGDTYSYLFNSKIHEGSSLYASAIANKLIDVLDTQYSTITY